MRLMILLALLLVSGSLSAQTQGAIKRVRHVSRFELAVACIKKYEGLHGPKHHLMWDMDTSCCLARSSLQE